MTLEPGQYAVAFHRDVAYLVHRHPEAFLLCAEPLPGELVVRPSSSALEAWAYESGALRGWLMATDDGRAGYVETIRQETSIGLDIFRVSELQEPPDEERLRLLTVHVAKLASLAWPEAWARVKGLQSFPAAQETAVVKRGGAPIPQA